MPLMIRRIKMPRIPRWAIRRISFMIMVLLAAVIINFILPRAMPGDVTDYLIGSDAPPEVYEAVYRELGLDRPVWEQFFVYLKNVVTGNLGVSFRWAGKSVGSMIAETLPRTLALLIPAEIIAIAIGYVLGVISGWRAGSKMDSFITGFGLILWAMPMFWGAMVFLYLGGFVLEWFPLRGYRTVGVDFTWFGMILDRIWYLILPGITLITKFGATQLVMRNTMTITLKQNYIITAKAKGLSESRVKQRHAARNALMPVVTSTALRMATMAAGLIFIESIFSYPGMGKLIYDAIITKDYPVMQATFLVFAIVIIATIFILDLIYARLDPRVRYD